MFLVCFWAFLFKNSYCIKKKNKKKIQLRCDSSAEGNVIFPLNFFFFFFFLFFKWWIFFFFLSFYQFILETCPVSPSMVKERGKNKIKKSA